MKQKAILPWHAETLKQSTWRIPALLAVTGVMFFWCLGRCGHNFWWSESRQQGPRPHPDWDTEMQLKHLDLTMSFWGLYCYCPIGKSSIYHWGGGIHRECECFFFVFFWGSSNPQSLFPICHSQVHWLKKPSKWGNDSHHQSVSSWMFTWFICSFWIFEMGWLYHPFFPHSSWPWHA